MRYSHRFFLYAPVTLFLALAIGTSVHWWIAAQAFDKKLTALNGHAIMPGVRISYATKTISGFPFRMDAVFTGFSLAGAGAHGPFVWRSDSFALHSLTYGRTQDIFEAAGQQSLSWTDGAGKPRAVSFLPGELRASVIADSRGLARFDLDARAVAGGGFTAARLQLHMRRDPDGQDLDLMAAAQDLKLPAGSGMSLSGDLRIFLTLTKAAVLTPLLQGKISWPQGAAAWAAQSGTAKPTQAMPQGAAALLSSLY